MTWNAVPRRNEVKPAGGDERQIEDTMLTWTGICGAEVIFEFGKKEGIE